MHRYIMRLFKFFSYYSMSQEDDDLNDGQKYCIQQSYYSYFKSIGMCAGVFFLIVLIVKIFRLTALGGLIAIVAAIGLAAFWEVRELTAHKAYRRYRKCKRKGIAYDL